MAKLIRDPEVVAMSKISNIVDLLEPDARVRVAQWIQSRAGAGYVSRPVRVEAAGECKHPGYVAKGHGDA